MTKAFDIFSWTFIGLFFIWLGDVLLIPILKFQNWWLLKVIGYIAAIGGCVFVLYLITIWGRSVVIHMFGMLIAGIGRAWHSTPWGPENKRKKRKKEEAEEKARKEAEAARNAPATP